jgi:Endonuclease/Exonuclease/phosphatase family
LRTTPPKRVQRTTTFPSTSKQGRNGQGTSSAASAPASSSSADQNNAADDADGAATRLERLTIVTYNVAGCQPSAAAAAASASAKARSSSWTVQDSLRSVRDVILREDPDVIALQEFPADLDLTPPSSTTTTTTTTTNPITQQQRQGRRRLFPDHDLVGIQSSHAPHVALFVRRGVHSKRIVVPVQDADDSSLTGGSSLPAVVVELTHDPPVASAGSEAAAPKAAAGGNNGTSAGSAGGTSDQDRRRFRRRLWIASVHLEPFAGGATIRHRQVRALVELADDAQRPNADGGTVPPSHAHVPLLVAGDFNMRVSEDATMEGERKKGKTKTDGDGTSSLDLLDLWKLAGGDIATKYTWNTRDEIGRGGYFNQYYGRDTRQYIARYDRIYYHCNSVPGAAAAATGDAKEDTNKRRRTEAGSAAVRTPTIQVESFKLIGNTPVGSSKTHFLSDHFGISSTFRLHWADED